jgi:DNA polymerase-3 subunit chi
MNQVDFYILKPGYPKELYRFVCQLIEQVYGQGRRIYVNLGQDAEARHLDQLLWNYREGSFVPHGLLSEADPKITPVLLGSGWDPIDENDVLITLAPVAPEFFRRFQRVAEIIDQDPERLRAGRERYRWYRDLGCDLRVHEMTA